MDTIGTYIIRPAAMSDAPALLSLIKKSTGGLSSLQPRLEFLQDYINGSVHSFSGEQPLEAPHKYLLVMTDDDRLIGCAAVKTQIGVASPFINFDIKGDGLDQVLEASSRFAGATEVGSLFLDSDYRETGLGRYLAKARYLLIAAEPWRFGETIIAELRGDCGAHGSPLYDYLFKDKLEMDFLEADAEFYDRNPDALGDIVPLGQIPAQDLPLDVKASLAQPHPSGVAALRLLQREGFIFSGTIDLFDGGPIMSAYRDTIRTIMNSRMSSLSASPSASTGQATLISAGDVQDFRAVITNAQASDNGLLVNPDVLHDLDVAPQTRVRYWQAKPRPVQSETQSDKKSATA